MKKWKKRDTIFDDPWAGTEYFKRAVEATKKFKEEKRPTLDDIDALFDELKAAKGLGQPRWRTQLRPRTVEDFFEDAGAKLVERGKNYDAPNGERSGSKVAVAFTALTGKHLTAAEVYLVMQLVKDARQWSCPTYHEDSAVDGIAFSVLKAEALASEA
jgi:hypothetical protein